MPFNALCTSVSEACPVSDSIYGYRLNIGGNIFFVVIWSILLLIHFPLSIYYRTWTFLVAMGLTCIGELIGYAARIILTPNPYSVGAYSAQFAVLIISPAFLSAACYLTLKHITLSIDRSLSRIPPKAYTWTFIFADVGAIVIQAVGGGLSVTATSAHPPPNAGQLADTGSALALAGVSLQAVTIGIFILAMLEYLFRAYRKSRAQEHLSDDGLKGETRVTFSPRPRFKFFIGAVFSATMFLFVRCLYRIAELAHGWNSALVHDQTLFMIFDSTMVACCAILLTVAYPGWYLPSLRSGKMKVKEQVEESGESGADGSEEHEKDREGSS